jgi:hypothetical protein
MLLWVLALLLRLLWLRRRLLLLGLRRLVMLVLRVLVLLIPRLVLRRQRYFDGAALCGCGRLWGCQGGGAIIGGVICEGVGEGVGAPTFTRVTRLHAFARRTWRIFVTRDPVHFFSRQSACNSTSHGRSSKGII